MARLKNAFRGHFVQAYTPGAKEPGEEWLELAKYISDIADGTDEQTDTEAFYDGDGTEEETVIGVAGVYSPSGHYDPEDPAQALIAGLKYKTGEGRKIWHKVVSSDGTTEWVARATVTGIIAGAGEASAYEEFACNIRFDTLPVETEVTPGG